MIPMEILTQVADNFWYAMFGVAIGFCMGYVVRGQRMVKEETHEVLETIKQYVDECQQLRADKEKTSSEHARGT
jgi:cell division protein FtsB